MTAHFRTYAEDLHHAFGLYATWLPDERIELGDIGLIQDGHFERVTSLAKKGLTFGVRESQGRSRHQHTSSNVREISAGASLTGMQLQPAPQLGGKAELRFLGKHGFVFHFVGARYLELDDTDALGDTVRKLYDSGGWTGAHWIVTKLMVVESATILIASASDARIEFEVKGELGPEGVNFADANCHVAFTAMSGVGTRVMSIGPLTPLFGAKRLRRTLWDPKRTLRSLHSAGSEAPKVQVLEEPSLRDFLAG